MPILGHPWGGSSFDLIRLMAYEYQQICEKKKKKSSTLTYHTRLHDSSSTESLEKALCPDSYSEGEIKRQLSSSPVDCFIFHFILHIPILSPDLLFSCDLKTVAVGTSRSALIAFFFFPTLFSRVINEKKMWLGYSFAEWIVSSFITSATGGLSAPIKATIHFRFSLPDNIQVWKESRSANYIFI